MKRFRDLRSRLPIFAATIMLGFCTGVFSSPRLACGQDTPLSFNQDIRPILSEYCFACHGPDEHDRAADLRLDQFEAAVDHGAIEPGEPDESDIVERIYAEDADVLMPPPETGKSLTEQQKQTLVRWIKQGAEYEKHWSFEPIPESVAAPKIGDGWAINAVDRFVAAGHEQQELEPSPPANKETWLRRVTFDLTGLPPTIAEIDAFVADESSDAYEKTVDRLLHSPAYGERMASMWLDVSRYADTFGYQNDIVMEVWPWRQWVITAFNNNMPYDQFVTEQIAGDLLPNATVDQRLATTFNRLHRLTNEGGSIPEEFRLTGIADRTTTAGTAFLGLTMECCRCHDHKFDPITQKEFYQLASYFSDVDELGLYSHFTFAAPPPAMPLYTGDQEEQHQAAKTRIADAQQKLTVAIDLARSKLDSNRDNIHTKLPAVPKPVYHNTLEGEVDGPSGKATRFDGDKETICEDAPIFGRSSPFSYNLWINPADHKSRTVVLHQSRAAEDSGFRGIQLVLENGHPQFSMIHFWPGDAVRVQAVDPVSKNVWSHIAVTHDGSGRADGIAVYVNGKPAKVEVIRDALTRDVRHRADWGDLQVEKVKLALGARFRDIGFRDGKLDDLKVFDRPITAAEVMSIFHDASGDPSDVELDHETAIKHQIATSDEAVAQARAALVKARDDENEMYAGVRMIMTMQHDADAPALHILERGDYASKKEPVSAATPALTGGLSAAGEDRLSLAKWMVDQRNPLTARVMANRIWHLFFGRGIVVSLEDFGSQGTPPSHPKLLDHLSRLLIDSGWDVHQLCREIVLSATYRQSSNPTDPNAYEQDPNNVYLARGPKHRLSAEQLRDSVLAASGLLVDQIGGPSVMPYQPPGLWKEAGTGKTYQQSKGDGLYRRSLYTFWKRTAPPPSMLTLDATSRESCTPRRELTTTPLQALVFLNDPQYVEASRVLAEELIIGHADDLDGRWEELFRRLVSRPPADEERDIIGKLYQEQLAYFQGEESSADEFLKIGTQSRDPSVDAIDLAATSVVTQAVFAYDETIMLR